VGKRSRHKDPEKRCSFVKNQEVIEDCQMLTATSDPRAEDEQIERAIFALLLQDARRPWAASELIAEIGDASAVTDALRRLRGAGLIHQLKEGLVFISRAAVRAVDLIDI
jgi:hypothetical protein